MNSLYLLQFASFIFMVINAAFIGMSRLQARWENKRYERSRWMIFLAYAGLAGQYIVQMQTGLRATGDDIGAIVNMLIYTPCFTLIANGIYNIEATHDRRRKLNVICSILYLCIIASFCAGYWQKGTYHIGWWFYVMLFFYTVCMVHCVFMIVREMQRRRKMLETMAANDMLPYVQYSRASVLILCSAALVMPAVILSSTLLYIVGPMVMLALLFFNLTFISLGSSYMPTEELLDVEEEMLVTEREERIHMGEANSKKQLESERNKCKEISPSSLTEERRDFIKQSLEDWIAKQGYKDSSVNMMTLSEGLRIAKSDMTKYFDQCLHTTFRIWLADIRFQAAKNLMLERPDYSNDVISVECGFSVRSYLYRIFKEKEGCTPTAWRDKNIAK